MKKPLIKQQLNSLKRIKSKQQILMDLYIYDDCFQTPIKLLSNGDSNKADLIIRFIQGVSELTEEDVINLILQK